MNRPSRPSAIWRLYRFFSVSLATSVEHAQAAVFALLRAAREAAIAHRLVVAPALWLAHLQIHGAQFRACAARSNHSTRNVASSMSLDAPSVPCEVSVAWCTLSDILQQLAVSTRRFARVEPGRCGLCFLQKGRFPSPRRSSANGSSKCDRLSCCPLGQQPSQHGSSKKPPMCAA